MFGVNAVILSHFIELSLLLTLFFGSLCLMCFLISKSHKGMMSLLMLIFCLLFFIIFGLLEGYVIFIYLLNG